MNRKSLSAGKSLSLDDRTAVDLILNHGSTHQSVASPVTAGAAQMHVDACTRLLSMLDAMPIAEPPADLVARTMSRIDAASRPVAAQPTVSAPSTFH